MGSLRAGVSKTDITPDLGTHLSGYIRRFGLSKGVHDPLRATSLWVSDENDEILFVSLDVMNMSEDFAARAKEVIAGESWMREDDILIAAIHTHSAPGIHVFRDGSERNAEWEERVLGAVADGVREARQRSKKASLGTGTGRAAIGYNRHKTGGAVDPTLTMAGFFDDRGAPFSLVANYGCHPVVLAEDNLHISADYVGYFRDQLEVSFSTEVISLFFTGATGDVDPVERGSFQAAEGLAGVLSGEAMRVLSRMKRQAGGAIKTSRSRLRIPYGWLPSVEDAEKTYEKSLSAYRQALEEGDNKEVKIRKAFLLWAEDLRKTVKERDLPDFLECDLQAVKLGEAVFLAFPFELFASLSLELRKRCEVPCLFLVGYANGYHGYLGDEAAVREGGYETEMAFKYTGLLPFSAEAGSLFLEKALALCEIVSTG